MKKVYLSAVIAVASFLSASAQNIDLEAVNTVPDGSKFCDTKVFSPNDPPGSTDSIHGIYGIQSNGPDAFIEGDQITYRSSFSAFLTEAEAEEEGVPFEDRYAWYSIVTLTEANITNGGFFFSFDSVKNIGMLLDWEIWDEYGVDSIVTYGPPHETFENGREYGFFSRTWGMGTSATDVVNDDPDLVNNWGVVRIIWNDCATSLDEMFVPKKTEQLTVYPNPAVGDVSFDYNFKENTYVTVYVRDITGRVLIEDKKGRILAGSQTLKVNVSALPAGNYNLEMITGEISASSKLTISK